MYTAYQLWDTCGKAIQVDVVKILTRSRTANVLVAQLVDALAMWCQLALVRSAPLVLRGVNASQ